MSLISATNLVLVFVDSLITFVVCIATDIVENRFRIFIVVITDKSMRTFYRKARLFGKIYLFSVEEQSVTEFVNTVNSKQLFKRKLSLKADALGKGGIIFCDGLDVKTVGILLFKFINENIKQWIELGKVDFFVGDNNCFVFNSSSGYR